MRPDDAGRIGLIESNDVREGRGAHPLKVHVSSHSPNDGCAAPVGELRGQRSDRAEHALHHDNVAVDRAVSEHSSVGGDPRNAQAGAELVRNFVGQIDGLLCGDHRQLRSGAERSVGLGAMHPHAGRP